MSKPMHEYRARYKELAEADNEFTSYGKLSANRDIRSTQIRQRHDELARQLREHIQTNYPVDPELAAKYRRHATYCPIGYGTGVKW